MTFLEWNDALLVGEREMDDDHRRLVVLVNEIADAAAAARRASSVSEAIARLVDATEDHFGREERMIRDSGDPNAIPHARDHGMLLSQLKILSTLIDDETVEAGTDLVRFIRGWLVSHVRTHDLALARHLGVWRAAAAAEGRPGRDQAA
ncbi:MAG: hemerythrin family protein [Rhodospirillales bacterium]